MSKALIVAYRLCDSGDLCRYFDIYPVYLVAFVV